MNGRQETAHHWEGWRTNKLHRCATRCDEDAKISQSIGTGKESDIRVSFSIHGHKQRRPMRELVCDARPIRVAFARHIGASKRRSDRRRIHYAHTPRRQKSLFALRGHMVGDRRMLGQKDARIKAGCKADTQSTWHMERLKILRIIRHNIDSCSRYAYQFKSLFVSVIQGPITVRLRQVAIRISHADFSPQGSRYVYTLINYHGMGVYLCMFEAVSRARETQKQSVREFRPMMEATR